MQNFSKIKKQKEPIKYTDKYDGYLKVKDFEGWEFVVESDSVICIPYLVDYREILIRKEVVPPYTYRDIDKSFFLTAVSGTIEEGEDPVKTVRREIQEECGIKLNTSYNNIKKLGEFFMTKGNSAKYQIFYIPLYKNDYTIVEAKGDGSTFEEKSQTVRVDKDMVKNLIPSDTITALCFEYIKNLNL